MAFEQKLVLPSKHEINYWRISDANIDFLRNTARFTFSGYIDYQHRLDYENDPADTRSLSVPSSVFVQEIPDYNTALPSLITTDLLVDETDAPFEGATTLSNMTWNKSISYKGLSISHFRISRFRANWNRKIAFLAINGYKDETTFDPENPIENTVQLPPELSSHRYSTAQFDQYFKASSVGGSSTDDQGNEIVDPLEGQLGLDRGSVYTYAKTADPFFKNATDSQPETNTN